MLRLLELFNLTQNDKKVKKMKLEELRKEIIGKELKTIISLDVNSSNTLQVRAITGYDYGDEVDSIEMMIFENDLALAFVDFDSDGYRSGDWFLVKLESLLDGGNTKDIKIINSKINDIQYFETDENDGKQMVLITTDKYVISMGQNNVSDYYPSNFFDVEEAKECAIKEAKDKVKGDIIEFT